MVIINISNEFVLSLNDFNTPKVLKDKEAIYTMILRLILLEPGTIQSHPDMGVGIVSKYRYAFDDKVSELKRDIDNQIATYLPSLLGVDVDIIAKDGGYSIKIIVDKVLYDFDFDSESGSLSLINL